MCDNMYHLMVTKCQPNDDDYKCDDHKESRQRVETTFSPFKLNATHII